MRIPSSEHGRAGSRCPAARGRRPGAKEGALARPVRVSQTPPLRAAAAESESPPISLCAQDGHFPPRFQEGGASPLGVGKCRRRPTTSARGYGAISCVAGDAS
jgi:hypothetical protein